MLDRASHLLSQATRPSVTILVDLLGHQGIRMCIIDLRRVELLSEFRACVDNGTCLFAPL